MCCNQHAQGMRTCAFTLAVVTTIVCVIALATPWFFEQFDNEFCTYTVLVGWQRAYCTDTGCQACEQLGTDWRSSAPDDVKRVFDVTGTFVGFGFALSLFASIFLGYQVYSARGAASQNGPPDVGKFPVLGRILLAAATCCLMFAVVYFPPALMNSSFFDDCGDSCSFFDSRTTGGATVSWGGAGWFPGLFAIVFALITLYVHVRSFSAPVAAYAPFAQGQQQQGPYGQPYGGQPQHQQAQYAHPYQQHQQQPYHHQPQPQYQHQYQTQPAAPEGYGAPQQPATNNGTR